MLHGHGTHPQLVAVLRLAMSMERFGDGDDPLIYWNDLCALLDQLESSLNERSVRQFGAAMTNKAQVAYIMYSLVGDALESAAQRLTGQAGLLRTLVEYSGVFILQYGPDRCAGPETTRICFLTCSWMLTGLWKSSTHSALHNTYRLLGC